MADYLGQTVSLLERKMRRSTRSSPTKVREPRCRCEDRQVDHPGSCSQTDSGTQPETCGSGETSHYISLHEYEAAAKEAYAAYHLSSDPGGIDVDIGTQH